ncbi:MAG TPA: hypothetical protein VG778_02960 [Blastocatellia bacterium]|jgi:hypothetical protein|nr:hypothetical protein [Blastocatellia bacterium]
MNVKAVRVAVLLLFASLFAVPGIGIGQTVSRSVVISRDAKLGGKVVSKGTYSLEFDKDKEGEATLSRNGREVSKVTYKLTALTDEADDSAVIFGTASDGSFEIRRIEIKGLKTALQF